MLNLSRSRASRQIAIWGWDRQLSFRPHVIDGLMGHRSIREKGRREDLMQFACLSLSPLPLGTCEAGLIPLGTYFAWVCQKFCVRAGCIDQSLKTNRSPNWIASCALAACHAMGGRFQFSVMWRNASQISLVAA